MFVYRKNDPRQSDKGVCGRPLRDEAAPSPAESQSPLTENVEERTVAVTPLLADILSQSHNTLHHGLDKKPV